MTARPNVVLIVADDMVLLQGDTDPGLPGSRFWQVPGGGVDEEESTREAAARELHEETGLRLDPGALVGPVYTRSAIFDFYRQHCRQSAQRHPGHPRQHR